MGEERKAYIVCGMMKVVMTLHPDPLRPLARLQTPVLGMAGSDVRLVLSLMVMSFWHCFPFLTYLRQNGVQQSPSGLTQARGISRLLLLVVNTLAILGLAKRLSCRHTQNFL